MGSGVKKNFYHKFQRILNVIVRFINRVAVHPDLQTDPGFVDFLEVEGDLPRATSTSALSGAGVMRLFNRVGDSISKTALRIEETDQVLYQPLNGSCSGTPWICSNGAVLLMHKY